MLVFASGINGSVIMLCGMNGRLFWQTVIVLASWIQLVQGEKKGMKLNNVLHKSFLHEEYPEKVIIETSNNTLAVCDISHINTSAVGTQ